MSYSIRLHVSERWLENVAIHHNSDWSGEARIRWDQVIREDAGSRELRTTEVRLPGCIIRALIEQTNGVAIERIKDLLQQLKEGT